MQTQESDAKKTWILENEVEEEILKFDEDENDKLFVTKPWTKEPRYFKHVRISTCALIKMVNHTKSGGDIEVMGLMQGKIIGETFYVLDAFALPVEACETRVNAGAEANEYLGAHLGFCPEIGREENCIGWYHSHPGYGPWLSGIDVGTQSMYQTVQEPWLAIVIDPHRTMSSGKVDLGCFRTLPEGVFNEEAKGDFGVPLAKIKDFGAHADKYYQISHSIFKSELDESLFDSLWNQYWVQTLSSNSLEINRKETTKMITETSARMRKFYSNPKSFKHVKGGHDGERGGGSSKEDGEVSNLVKGSTQTALQCNHQIYAEMMKARVFAKRREIEEAKEAKTD